MAIVYGVGIREDGFYKCTEASGGKATYLYSLWRNMLSRCYSKVRQEKKPSYIGCSVDGNFLNFQYFAKWCDVQNLPNIKDYQLDKDLLIKGNKVYSEETCLFVPRQINMTLVKSDAIRGKWPIGVCYVKKSGKFKAEHHVDNKGVHIGLFFSPEDAFAAYKKAKEKHIKHLAEEYKEVINEACYQALYKYEVHITD